VLYRLTNEQSVKRIAMQERQGCDLRDIYFLNRKADDLVIFSQSRYVRLRRFRQKQFSCSIFDNRFPQ